MGSLDEVTILAMLGVAGFIFYEIVKNRNQIAQLPANVAQAATAAVQNVNQAVASSLSPSLTMFPVGSGTTAMGNNYYAVSATGQPGGGTTMLNVNGMNIGLLDNIGPGGQTAQELLEDGWTTADIADYMAMSGTVSATGAAQAPAAATSNAPNVITINPEAY
jgi:hypothetical protein